MRAKSENSRFNTADNHYLLINFETTDRVKVSQVGQTWANFSTRVDNQQKKDRWHNSFLSLDNSLPSLRFLEIRRRCGDIRKSQNAEERRHAVRHLSESGLAEMRLALGIRMAASRKGLTACTWRAGNIWFLLRWFTGDMGAGVGAGRLSRLPREFVNSSLSYNAGL